MRYEKRRQNSMNREYIYFVFNINLRFHICLFDREKLLFRKNIFVIKYFIYKEVIKYDFNICAILEIFGV